MIKVFQKWARVKDVFISRRLNKWGKRFGFVRFFGVRDERSLERDLDQIYIGSRKLYVNIPKYRRHQYGPKKEEWRAPWELPRERQVIARKSDTKEDEFVRKYGGKEIWVEKSGKRTYAEAVTGEYQDGWKGVVFKTQHLSLPWMKRSVVGTLGDGMDFGMLGEELVKGGMSMIRARFLGDNLVMITPREGEVMEVIMKNNKEWFDAVFTDVKPWLLDSGASHKSVWVKCYGVPLPFWNKDCFSKVVGEISKAAKLVSIDNSTLTWEVLEYARLKVRVQNLGSVRLARKMRINKHVCSIFIEEEAIGCEGRGYRGNPYAEDSTDSVSSLDTYVEDTDFSEVNGEEKGNQRFRDDCWPEGGDGREKFGGDDEQYRTKSNFRFEGSTSKSKGNQGKGGLSFMNGESVGQVANESNLCVCLLAPDCVWTSYSNPTLADLAKVVVDIECLSNQKELSEGLAGYT